MITFNKVIFRLFNLISLGAFIYVFLFPQLSLAQIVSRKPIILEDQSLIINNEIVNNWRKEIQRPQPKQTHVITATAYTSLASLTDGSPWITASGTKTRMGVIAANFLPFGTKVRFPELYGDQEFIVEDRMAKRNYYKVDIWLSDYWQAKQFGVKQVTMEVY